MTYIHYMNIYIYYTFTLSTNIFDHFPDDDPFWIYYFRIFNFVSSLGNRNLNGSGVKEYETQMSFSINVKHKCSLGQSFHSLRRTSAVQRSRSIKKWSTACSYCNGRSGNKFCQRDIFYKISIIIHQTTYVGLKIVMAFLSSSSIYFFSTKCFVSLAFSVT